MHRFPGPAQLTCRAGLTPSHHESDTTVHRGRITKQGSRLVRWAAIESVKILPDTSRIGAIRERVAHRRGNRNIGAVAAARRQLELVRCHVVVTYDVTRLMRLDGPRRFLITLGGSEFVDPASVLAEMTYRHPLYTPESVAAQRLLPTIDDDRVVFAGAYHGWGFHEDGAASGLRAAQRLGGEWPSAARGERAASHAVPALYRTRITHQRRAPVRHKLAHRGYSWYVDVDALPRLPRWLRPFAGFDARDHLHGAATDSLRRRVDTFLAEPGVDLRGGTVTALMQARVFGFVFNSLTLFWCHDGETLCAT